MHSGSRQVVRTIVLSVVVPLIVVQVLLHRDVSAVMALTIAAAFPLVDAVLDVMRARRFAPIPALSLAALVFGIGTSIISNNASFAIARESIITAIFGVVFLGSLFARRPLMFGLARQFAAGEDAAKSAAFDGMWEREGFRRVMRTMTAVWGAGLLVEATARAIAAFTLPPTTSTIASPVIALIVIGGLIAWTVRYARASRRRAVAAGFVSPA